MKHIVGCFILVLLISCRGENPEKDEILPPVVHDTYSQLLFTDDNRTISLQDSVSDPQGLPLILESVVSETEDCANPVVEHDSLSFKVQENSPSICFFKYTIKNVPNDTEVAQTASSYSYVLMSYTTKSSVLPAISAVAMTNSVTTVNIKEELGSSYPEGYVLDSLLVVLGDGVAVVTDAENGLFEYQTGEAKGVNRIIYSLLSSDSSDFKVGYIDIAVSGGGNAMPVADDFQGPEDVPLDTMISIDVKDYISDTDGDDLQLTDAYAFNAEVSATDPTSAANTSFNFQASEPGRYDVSYYVYDHRNGYAVGTVRITVLGPTVPWDDIILDDGERYTAPWEQNGADVYNIPYQSLVGEVIDGNDYNIPLFNFLTASYLCNVRGMLLPSVDQLEKLFSGIGDVNANRLWPVANYYWSSDKIGVDLSNNHRETLSDTDVAITTCVYPGELSVETSIDGAFVADAFDDESDFYDELEATVVDIAGSGLEGKQLYAYSANSGLLISPTNVLTDTDGKARFKVRSTASGMFDVTVKYLTQAKESSLTFIDDVIMDYFTLPSSIELKVGESQKIEAFATYSSTAPGSQNVSDATSWSTQSGSDIISIDASGNVTGKAVGDAVVKASYADKTALTNISVIGLPTPTELRISPDSETMVVGHSEDFDVEGKVDGTWIAVDATWKAYDGLALDYPTSGVAASHAIVTAKKKTDSTLLVAFYDGLTAVATIAVNADDPDPIEPTGIEYIYMTPLAATLYNNVGSASYRVKAHYYDGSEIDVTTKSVLHSGHSGWGYSSGTGDIRCIGDSEHTIPSLYATYNSFTSATSGFFVLTCLNE
ncbi:MAG: Ig-like domain-containing protein [Vibrio fluvialis]